MNGPVHGRFRRLLVLLVPVAVAVAVVPAPPSGAAEEPRLSRAEVAERLTTIQTIAGDVAEAGAHRQKAVLLAEGIAPVWARVEDTIKANDEASYEALEAAIELLEEAARAGDATKAAGAAGALTSAVNFYVAKFPAGGSTDRKAASAAGKQTPAAASESRAAAEAPTPAERRTAAESPAAGEAPAAAPAAGAGAAALARTGPMSSALPSLGGAAFALGGLAVMAGARRPKSPIA